MANSLIIILLTIIIVALCTIIILLLARSPRAKGKQGERQVAKYLNKLPSKKYTVLNNVLLQNYKHSTQIDHIVFSQYGIFVIETKNYSGLIKGSENSETWTKEVYGNKFPFRNPLLQNNAHIQALKHILSIHDDKKIIPVVAFSNRAKLKVHSHKVVYYNKINKTIMHYKKKVFYKSEISRFINKIQNIASTNSPKAMKDHIKRVKEKQIIYEEKMNNEICPVCGSFLIEKKNRFGNFLICSDYPYCKYRKNVKTHHNNRNHHCKHNPHQKRKDYYSQQYHHQ